MDKSAKTIVICEDKPKASYRLKSALRSLGYSIHLVRNDHEVKSVLQARKVDISAVMLNMGGPACGTLDLLKELRSISSVLPIVIVFGAWPAGDMITALKHGATNFIGNFVADEELPEALATVLLSSNSPVDPAQDEGTVSHFLSTNQHIQQIDAVVSKVGLSEAPVLIQGETGSGKEILARRLHTESPRKDKAFLKLNCAALPSDLVESELFGYERGAFTGAGERKAGIFELADGGTILLDEIGDMDIRLQAKLLQVLQDQEFRRIGGKDIVRVNVRIIAATHRNLEKMIPDGSFREDLYYRLNVITLTVPALRERSEDIAPLAEFLIRKHSNSLTPLLQVTPDLKEALMGYNWPGNVRELENVVRKLVILQDPAATARDLHTRASRTAAVSTPSAEPPVTSAFKNMTILEQVKRAKQQAESEAIRRALDACRWNRKRTAMALGIDYKSLLYKMKKMAIDTQSDLTSS